jgi:hypothetical protein
LTNNDGARANQQDFMDVITARHRRQGA